MRIVAPFRFLPPEADHHKRLALARFNWPAALRMMAASAEASCRCPVHILTDPASQIDLPTLRYESPETRLMLWNLDIVARYLESPDFDQDTVVVDCDQLFYGDLSPWFSPRVDLGILIRPKKTFRIPILNGVMFLAARGGPALAAFFRDALEIAKGLSEDQIKWGADTYALKALLEPLTPGLHVRHGLRVSLMDHRPILAALTEHQIKTIVDRGRFVRPTVPVLDFRYMRKHYMRQVYDLTYSEAQA